TRCPVRWSEGLGCRSRTRPLGTRRVSRDTNDQFPSATDLTTLRHLRKAEMFTHSNTQLITLGTAAGPAIRGNENGMASAVVVVGKHYLVDFGLGCVRAAHSAGLRGQDLVAGFITH